MQAGLLERRPWYYAWKITFTVLLLAAGWAAFALIGDSWRQLAVAVFLAVVFTQVGFLGHDAGHRQIFRSRKANYVLGVLLGNLGIGLSYGWWVSKHNRHHAHPNTEGADPDIAIGALARRSSRRGTSHHWAWEAGLLAVHVAGYLTVVFLVLSPVKALVFIAVQQGLFGVYLGSSFAPNHKGMPIWTRPTAPASWAGRYSPPATSAADG
jgi:fatty acid desaturase